MVNRSKGIALPNTDRPLLPSSPFYSHLILHRSICHHICILLCCCFPSYLHCLVAAFCILASVFSHNGPGFCIEYFKLTERNAEDTRSRDGQWPSGRTKSPSWSGEIAEEEAQASHRTLEIRFVPHMGGSPNLSIDHLLWCICGPSRMLIRLDGHCPHVFTHPFDDPDTSWLALQQGFSRLVVILTTVIGGVALMATLTAAWSQSRWVWFGKASITPVHTPKLEGLDKFDQACKN